MKSGDIVRFWKYHRQTRPAFEKPPNIGLLIEYHTWEKIATILYEGNLLRIHARDVQLHKRL